MRSKESDPKKALRLLKEDLINGPHHCFGDHTHCSTDFCTSARERESGVSSSSGERVSSGESSGIHTNSYRAGVNETGAGVDETGAGVDETEVVNFAGMLVL